MKGTIKYVLPCRANLLSIVYEVSETTFEGDGVSISITLKMLESGEVYRGSWGPEDIASLHELFEADAELAIDVIKNKPILSELGGDRGTLVFTMDIDEHAQVFMFQLSREQIEGKENQPEVAQMPVQIEGKDNRLAAVEAAYVRAIGVRIGAMHAINQATIPHTYTLISRRFPHLTLSEIISFETKLRKAGTLLVHGGKYRQSQWSCCKAHTCKVPFVGGIFNAFNQASSRDPSGACRAPVKVYLRDRSPMTINIATQKIKNASAAIEANIGEHRQHITELLAEIDRLYGINEELKGLMIE